MSEVEQKKADQKTVEIQRLYIKDTSLETPNTPSVFRSDWKPDVSVEIDVKNASLEENVYEVVLSITVTAKLEDKTAFLVEVHQAGIFSLGGFEGEELEQILGVYCPTTLYPYAREAISDLVNKASFPPLNLAPLNFGELFMQQKQGQDTSAGETQH